MDKHPAQRPAQRPATKRAAVLRTLLASVLLVVVSVSSLGYSLSSHSHKTTRVPINAAQIVQQCEAMNVKPGPPSNFHSRSQSDRFAPGTPPTLIRNATIWTGRASGHEVVVGDLLLDKGIVKAVGKVSSHSLRSYKDLVVVDAGGAWVTPGIVDTHSHLGVDSVPELSGSSDTNSIKGVFDQ